MTAPDADLTILHASTVAIAGRGLLILGASGAGKSALALSLIALGAMLVADDRTIVTRRGATLFATCPPALTGMIEARGLGLLASPAAGETRLHLAVDLDRPETDRLPPRRSVSVLGLPLDLVLRSQGYHFPAAVLCYLKGGRTG